LSTPAGIGTSTLLIADISGYTRFLEAVPESHPEMLLPNGKPAPAYRVLSTLLDTVMDNIAPWFTLIQVEGDALFACAAGEQRSTGQDLIALARSCHAAFRSQIERAMSHEHHECKACAMLPLLELKFIVHHGLVIPQRIAGRELLAGPDVNLTHRLLKNSITERTGLRGYVFVTDPAAEALAMTPDSGVRYTESYADGQVSGILIALAPARSKTPSVSAELGTE
jgi:class 3 adenylate cyclase